MQLFINNWAATLTAPAFSGDLTLNIESGLAARLVGLGTGDYYLLTLVEAVAGEPETAWEIVKVTGATGGVLSVERHQEGTEAAAWSAGTQISARATAGTLEALQVVPRGAYVEVGDPGVTAVGPGASVVEVFASPGVVSGDFILDLPAPAAGEVFLLDVVAWAADLGNRLIFRSGVDGVTWGGFVGDAPAGVAFVSGELRIQLLADYALRVMFVGSSAADERYLNVALLSASGGG